MNENLDNSADATDSAIRQKSTDVHNVLPPVSKLIAGKHTILRYIDLDGNERELNYCEWVDKDPYPIPMPVDREGYGSVDTSAQFWATGLGDWLNVKDAVDRYGIGENANRLFDFGCATCRFLRHVWTFSDIEPHGCDFAPANIAWVKQHLPDDLQVVLNTTKPELPYPDDHFDVVTAFSVFTHINTDAEQWLAELKRITHPGGLLYLTIQNQAAWDKVLERPGSLEHLLKANGIAGNPAVSSELFQSPMPSDRIVFRMSNDDIYNCNVWFNNQYVFENWSKQFEILDIADNAHTGFQSPVIMRPR